MNKLYKYSEYFLAFIAIFFILSPKIMEFCTIYSNLNFDSQALLTWDYGASIGMQSYKDIFYPYGILSYLKDHNLFFHFLYLLISPILFTISYSIFKKLWGKKSLAVVSSITFFLFIASISGFDVFNRYGIIVLYSLILAYITYKYKFLSKKLCFLLGILGGLVSSLITDQGIYMAILSLFTIVFFSLFKKRSLLNWDILGNTVIYAVGLTIGFLPYLSYMILNGSYSYFLTSFLQLLDISLYAKTPFIPSLKSPSNIFTFSIFLPALGILGFKLASNVKKDFNFYLQLFLVVVLTILMQKSIIRSIDSQLVFVALLLLFTLLKDIERLFKTTTSQRIIFCFFFIILISMLVFFPLKNKVPNRSNLFGKSCIDNNVNTLISEDYRQLKDKIKGKIYAFPSDPIFYLLFNQDLPYYSNNYDSSAEYSQKKQIEYIEKNNIQYVIYNYQINSVQDEVPNYIRTPYEMKYIFSNFFIENKIGKFLILKKSLNTVDLFASEILNDNLDFKEYISTIDLANIPFSEGLYKSRFLHVNKNESIVSVESSDDFNNFLKNNAVSSNNKILKLTPSQYKTKNKTMTIAVNTLDGKTSRILLNKCEIRASCIINLRNIPLFYRERFLKEMTFDDFEGNMELVDNFEGIFW